eukprot:1150656-Pelagomonas_calceolata.AAC.2
MEGISIGQSRHQCQAVFVEGLVFNVVHGGYQRGAGAAPVPSCVQSMPIPTCSWPQCLVRAVVHAATLCKRHANYFVV